ncbi:DUF3492 domain-containing protein, partial [Streptomyces sp. SID9913]|uniref:DUF3492 domain-containing protein n=1 Tax=Streptomyces sp. SID9913 TaxID=2706117 RepID=UPI0013D95013|nr:DUF3492 domain-containing protein [Streptomyces sp. SID9913]
MRIGLLTEGGFPYLGGDAGLWCDRLVRGLGQHEFDVYAFSRSEAQEDAGWAPLPPQVARVRTAPLWAAEDDGVVHGRRARRRFMEHYGELAAVLCAPDHGSFDAHAVALPDAHAAGDADEDHRGGRGGMHPGGTPGPLPGAGRAAPEADRFANALYGLAELARDEGGLVSALRSEPAVRALER